MNRTIARCLPVVRSSFTPLSTSNLYLKSFVGSSAPNQVFETNMRTNSNHQQLIASENLFNVSYEEPVTDAVEMELHGGVRRSVIKKKRTHGFLQRMASTGGRRVLRLRRNKGRKFLTV